MLKQKNEKNKNKKKFLENAKYVLQFSFDSFSLVIASDRVRSSSGWHDRGGIGWYGVVVLRGGIA